MIQNFRNVFRVVFCDDMPLSQQEQAILDLVMSKEADLVNNLMACEHLSNSDRNKIEYSAMFESEKCKTAATIPDLGKADFNTMR